jgi:7-carboxy-7-deazaguanine synthase
MTQIKGRVAEVFESAQGEGLYIGVEQVFIRLYGCNLACDYCDTRIDKFTEYTADELIQDIALYPKNIHSLSFTGGEPLLQADFLAQVLPPARAQGYRIYLETNGTLPDALSKVVESVDIIAMDLKLPSSTGGKLYWKEHEKFLRIASSKEVFVKSVISLATDEDDILTSCALIGDINPQAIYVLQPNGYDDQAALLPKLKEYQAVCRSHRVTACIIPQMHKIVGIR